MSDKEAIQPVGSWGRKQLYQAKVGTGPSTLVMVKGCKVFSVGQHIQYCQLQNVQGMCTGCTPPWSGGLIYKIENDRLFIEMM